MKRIFLRYTHPIINVCIISYTFVHATGFLGVDQFYLVCDAYSLLIPEYTNSMIDDLCDCEFGSKNKAFLEMCDTPNNFDSFFLSQGPLISTLNKKKKQLFYATTRKRVSASRCWSTCGEIRSICTAMWSWHWLAHAPSALLLLPFVLTYSIFYLFVSVLLDSLVSVLLILVYLYMSF